MTSSTTDLATRMTSSVVADQNWDEQKTELLREALISFGRNHDEQLMPHLGFLYRLAVAKLPTAERVTLFESLRPLLEAEDVGPSYLLPFVIFDPHEHIASTAAIDLLAYSRLSASSVPFGLMQLMPLMESRIVVNAGAVFGGIVSYGDSRLRVSLDILSAHLSADDFRVAARMQTGFVQHTSIDFWLSFAEKVVSHETYDALSVLGSVGSALTLARRNTDRQTVDEAERYYPVTQYRTGSRLIRQWSLEDYGRFIEPRLAAIEAAESEPRVFSVVMREWGVEPRWPIADRFIEL